MRIAVVGAGMAGLRAAEQLRAAGWDEAVTVLGDEPFRPYNRPPLSKEVLAETVPEAGAEQWHRRLAFRERAAVADVEWLLGDPVVRSDLDGRSLATAAGRRLEYDGLVVATGLRSRRLPFGAPARGRFALRGLTDAVALRRHLVPGARVVVVGGGFVGCEVAATASRLGCAVTVVEPEPVCLRRGLGDLVGGLVQEHLSAGGIRVRTGRTVSALGASADEPDRVGSVELDDGTGLAADVVVEAVGSVPNVEWLAGNGLDLSDGVLCGDELLVEGRRDAVAVGDVARFANPRFDDVPRRVEHWSMPGETARHAAGSLLRALAGTADDRPPFAPLPSFWSDQLDLRIQSFGSPGLADTTELVEGGEDPGALTEGLVAHYRRGAELVGVILVNPSAAGMREHRQLLTGALAA